MQFCEHFVLTRRLGLYTVMYSMQWPAFKGTIGLGDAFALRSGCSQRPSRRCSSVLLVGATCQSPHRHRPYWTYLWRRRRRAATRCAPIMWACCSYCTYLSSCLSRPSHCLTSCRIKVFVTPKQMMMMMMIMMMMSDFFRNFSDSTSQFANVIP